MILSGCASVKPVVKIGLVAPFEGRARAVGYDAIYACLLYTSDAADERSSVDLGGRRIIKKKTAIS